MGYNFTDEIRHTLQQAREEAATLRHGELAPEHLLLGIVRQPGSTCSALFRELGADPETLYRQTASVTTSPEEPESTGPDLPYTPSAKKAIELAMSEARSLNHDYVGVEHLVLGLLREGSSPAATVLAGTGLTLSAAREALRRLAPPSQRQALNRTARRALLIALVALAIAIVALLLALRTPR